MKNKILIFGDSITYGQRDLELGGWTNRLKLAIANDSSIASCHVFNMGISGQTTGEVLERLERECAGRVLGDANNILILAAGINDTQLIDGDVLVREEKFRSDVTELIEAARRQTDSVIYLGLTPVDETRTNPVRWDRTKNWRNDLISAYDEIISEICAEEGVRYVYVYDQIDPSGNEDGLHPSADGHAIITDIMTNVVYDYLKKDSPAAALSKTAGEGGGIRAFIKKLFG